MSIKANERNSENLTRPPQERNQQENVATQSRAQRFQLLMQKKAPLRPAVATNFKGLKKPLKTQQSHERLRPELGEKFENVVLKGNDSSLQQLTNTAVSHQAKEISVEKDPTIIAQTAIASGRADDINLLIKKLTLNFSAKHNEARFAIATGIFEGAQFSLIADNHDLRLRVSNASMSAQRLLIENQSLLKESLAIKEINLRDLTFLT